MPSSFLLPTACLVLRASCFVLPSSEPPPKQKEKTRPAERVCEREGGGKGTTLCSVVVYKKKKRPIKKVDKRLVYLGGSQLPDFI